ncbi:MAG: hypothetical protein DME55_12815 [Verrucomicrobia bacterium]|nr:MAG: hypothetical protein DME55_12815 [Verrucomicrobiota bacterium]
MHIRIDLADVATVAYVFAIDVRANANNTVGCRDRAAGLPTSQPTAVLKTDEKCVKLADFVFSKDAKFRNNPVGLSRLKCRRCQL